MDYNWADFGAMAPVIVLVVGGCSLILSEVFLTSRNRGYQAGLSAAFAIAAALIAFSSSDEPARELFGGYSRFDAFGAYATTIICASLALFSLVGGAHMKALASERGEFHGLAQFGAAGMVMLATATDLVTMFVALEVMSLAVYALTAWVRSSARPAEAALKYFILGSFASAIFLYGASLVYGAAGSTKIADIAATQPSELLAAGLALLAGGFLFKVAAVPFHTWAPDVYDGAPTSVTGFMAAGVKAAAFAAFVRVLYAAFGSEALALGTGEGRGGWFEALKWIAIATMVVGNVLAVAQKSVKRMLAYSSISHAGYLLVGVAVGATASVREAAIQSTLFYLAAYAATSVGAFAIVASLEKRGGRETDDDDRYEGLAQRQPALALAMAIFMLSLAGIPPTAGFAAKLFIFRAALDANEILLTVVGLLSSVAGLFYYLRVIVLMYMRPSSDTAPVAPRSAQLALGLGFAVAATVLFGLMPSWLSDYAKAASNLGAMIP